MTWLLGAGTAVGALGLVILAIQAVRMARDLIECEKDLAVTKINLSEHSQTIDELTNALRRKENELAREVESRRIAEVMLSRVRQTLAKNMSATGIVADIGDTLDRLRKMSAMSKAASESHQNVDSLHGSAAGRNKPPGRGNSPTGSK